MTAAEAPRLSAGNTTATVVIIDDENGAGVFQLSPVAATTEEGSILTFSVLRTGGTSGSASLLVQTVDSGLATSGSDYLPINQEVLFENGVSRVPISTSIVDDDIPESAEGFSIILSAPNGVALVDSNAVSEQQY